MIIVFLGAPGTGKGTQAVRLAEKHKLTHISTGDLLRKEMAEGTALGLKVKDIISKGSLVSDDIINDVMKHGIKKGVSYILDGYPRTVPQAQFLDSYLSSIGEKVHSVIFFEVPEDIIMKRLTGRRKCSGCGKDFNVYFHPSTTGDICDVCGRSLSQRADDKEDVIKHRLVTYQKETSPLLSYYQEKDLLKKVDGSQPIDQVQKELSALLNTRI